MSWRIYWQAQGTVQPDNICSVDVKKLPQLSTCGSNIQCELKKSPSPKVFWHFSPNRWDFLFKFYMPVIRFYSRSDSTTIFYLIISQLLRSYAILSTTTQFTSYVQNVHHRPKCTLAFFDIFAKQLGIFSPNFTRLLHVPIYARLQIFIQLFLTLTKLCHFECVHPACISADGCHFEHMMVVAQVYDSLFLLFSKHSCLQLLSSNLYNSSFLISRLLTVSFFYLLFFYPASFLPIHHAAIHHVVKQDPSIYIYGTLLCSIFFHLLDWAIFNRDILYITYFL